jgi:predicted ferric reductase
MLVPLKLHVHRSEMSARCGHVYGVIALLHVHNCSIALTSVKCMHTLMLFVYLLYCIYLLITHKQSSVFAVPYLGWLGLAFGCVPIDRTNREAAVASMTTAGKDCQR